MGAMYWFCSCDECAMSKACHNCSILKLESISVREKWKFQKVEFGAIVFDPFMPKSMNELSMLNYLISDVVMHICMKNKKIWSITHCVM